MPQKGYYLQLLPYYSILLVQRLAFTPSYMISERASILRSLAGLLYEKYSIGKRKENNKLKQYSKYLTVLSRIELQAKLVENQIRELEYEIYYGNVFDIDNEYVKKYAELMSEISKIEASIINDLQQILGESIPINIFLPSTYKK